MCAGTEPTFGHRLRKGPEACRPVTRTADKPMREEAKIMSHLPDTLGAYKENANAYRLQ